MKLKPATTEDAKIFYDARFSDEAVRNSKIKEIPTFKQHCEWFKKQDFSKMYVMESDKSAGYLRIDDDNFVSIAILPEETGKGLGSFALSEIVKKHQNLKSEIYEFNTASIKLFSKFPQIKTIILKL